MTYFTREEIELAIENVMEEYDKHWHFARRQMHPGKLKELLKSHFLKYSEDK